MSNEMSNWVMIAGVYHYRDAGVPVPLCGAAGAVDRTHSEYLSRTPGVGGASRVFDAPRCKACAELVIHKWTGETVIRVRGLPLGDAFPLIAAETVPDLAVRAARQPVPSGNLCKCGGLMVRTETCETCSSCGTSSGGCG